MPSWGVHLKIASIVAEKIEIKNKNQFIIGNVLPDINNGYVVTDIHKIIDHKITHFSGRKDYKNYETFYEKYNGYLKNPYILGYLTHILSDRYFNNIAYSEKTIFDDDAEIVGLILNSGREIKCNSEEVRKTKIKDFSIFANYIYKNYDLPKIKYDDGILLASNIIEEIDVNEQDAENVIQYLNSKIENRKDIKDICLQEYKMFTQEELIKIMNSSVEFILEYLNKKEKTLLKK